MMVWRIIRTVTVPAGTSGAGMICPDIIRGSGICARPGSDPCGDDGHHDKGADDVTPHRGLHEPPSTARRSPHRLQKRASRSLDVPHSTHWPATRNAAGSADRRSPRSDSMR